nr:HNH endonuclease signature motif containing protein [Cellulomonas sp. APG4]
MPHEDLLPELSVRVARAVHRLQVCRLGWLTRIEADGRWALDAVRSFAHWVAWSHGLSLATARRDVRLARTLRDDLPLTAAAAAAGQIGPDHVWALASIAATSDARRAALAAPVAAVEDVTPQEAVSEGARDARTGEQVLVELAAQHRVEPFRRVLHHFAAVADPDAADRAFADAAEREFVELAATTGGFHLAGFLTTEHGQVLRTALDAVGGVPAADDRRSTTQRRAQALADLGRTVLDHGLAGAGSAVRPHLAVTVSWTELRAELDRTGADRDPVTGAQVDWDALLAEPPARWLDGTGPVPSSVLKRLACDGNVSRIVFGPESQVLNVGRRERTFTGSRRVAVIARDGGCVWPGCHAPPAQCEVHHALTPWAAHGETSTDNAALLCWFHHAHVDGHGITMRHERGRWRFRRRDGTEVEDGPRGRAGSRERGRPRGP